jgi:ribosomal protein S27AE
VPSRKSVRVQCLRCGHFSVLTPDMLSRFAIAPNTPIAAFVKRLRCRKCGSQSVLATRATPQQPIAAPITKR